MKKGQKIFLCFIFTVAMINLLLLIVINNSNKQKDYYIGKTESMEKKDGISSVEVSPVSSNRSFLSEIKVNHKIEFASEIGIVGLREKNRKMKELYLGQLKNEIDRLKVGDSIIFKVKNYNENDMKLEIDKLAVDITLD